MCKNTIAYSCLYNNYSDFNPPTHHTLYDIVLGEYHEGYTKWLHACTDSMTTTYIGHGDRNSFRAARKNHVAMHNRMEAKGGKFCLPTCSHANFTNLLTLLHLKLAYRIITS